MTERDQKRAVALNRVLAGQWSRAEAAIALGVSHRQVRRLLAAYEARGPTALVHGNRGRQPAHALAAAVRAQVLALANGTYAGFNDQHLTEKLAEAEGIVLGRTTVRAILRGGGRASPRVRRPPTHRGRRERMAQAGMLVQADGSRHTWLGPKGPYLTLIAGVDDATGTVPWALFREQEDAAGYMMWLRHVVETVGVPVALYVDRHGIFRRGKHEPLTRAEELAGGPLPTQFGRVLQELGVALIHALSPQAKGRIERLFGTLQDRLTSELRLAGITSLADANAFLPGFLPVFNARFAVPAADPTPVYRSPPAGLNLERVFCFRYTRVVAADNTVRFASHAFQVLPDAHRISYARATVDVLEHLDGAVSILHHGCLLAARDAPPDAPTLRARHHDAPRTAAPHRLAPWPSPPPKPPGAHPWRRYPQQQNGPAAPKDCQPVPSRPVPSRPVPSRPVPSPNSLPLVADHAQTGYPPDQRTKSPAT